MGKGYMGKILNVNLETKTIEPEMIPDEVYQKYLSGLGLGAYLLYHRIPEGADPLGKDNILGFISGLLTGTGSFFTGRWMVVGKSPLTGGWGDANCGGNFSPAIKRCGYDGIFFSGISDKPVYLYLDNEVAELRDASDLWGKDAVEAEEILIERYKKKKARVACIGTAGEKLSCISGVTNDRGRIAARSGLGAVMGSKLLKAVVLAGKKNIIPCNRTEMKALSKKCNKWVKFQPPFIPGDKSWTVGALLRTLPSQTAQDGMLYKIMLRKWGTVSMNQVSMEMGDSPVKNWKGSSADFGPDKSDAVNPDVFTDAEIVKYHCYSCPLGCGGICKINTDRYPEYKETHKPEYESVICLGALCMNEDPDSLFYMNEVLNRAGMDTISAGHTLAFAIECFEKGIITTEDTDGLDLTWGNTDAIVAMLHKMINREGLGDILADGVKIAAKRLGKGANEYAINAGGQEPAAHDGRNDPGFAVHYCVEPTPGRHTIGSQLYYEMFQLWKKMPTLPSIKPMYSKDIKYVVDEEKAITAAACSQYMNVVNGAGGCLFGALLGCTRTPYFDWLNAATGWDLPPEAYMELGKNIQTIKQAFNIKHGIDPWSFKINPRALGMPPQTEGANKGRFVDIEPMMKDYWRKFDWDPENGHPKQKSFEIVDRN